MRWITIILSMAAATSLTLAAVHLRVWLRIRGSRENLLFTLASVSAAAVAMLELRLLHARTPAEYGDLFRWLHLPVGVLVIMLAWFIRSYLRAGRDWLAWLITGLRALLLVANFSGPSGATFGEITGLHTVVILGEALSVPEGTESPWRFVAHLSALLLIVHALDAGLAARRRRTRPRPMLLGGVIAYATLQSVVAANLMARGVLPGPFISLGFLMIVLAMAYELSTDLVNANRLARDLHESQARMQLAAQAADLALWEWDVARDEFWIAGPSQSGAGATPGEPLSLDSFLQSVHPDDRDATREAVVRAVESDVDLHVAYRLASADGTTRWIDVRGTVERDAGGRARLVRGASRDITARKSAEAELDLRRSELAHVQRVSTLEQLSSALAHQLSQPLGAILRNAEAADLLLREVPPDLDEIRAIVLDIRDDDQRAAAITNRMRALMKRRELKFEAIAVRTLIADVEALLRSEFQARGASLRVYVPPGLADVQGDRVHLQQVILNLVLNGLDAVEGKPDARRELVVRASETGNGMVEIAVVDQGEGIPPDRLPHLFEPFFTSKAEGSGIGLSISKTIVELHGGRVWAEPNREGGATFRFTLRAAQPGTCHE